MYKVVFVECGHDYRSEHDIGPFDTRFEAEDWIGELKWDLSENAAECDSENVEYYEEGLGFRIEDMEIKLHDPAKWAAANSTWEDAHAQP